ncbi:S41 family peptidase [Pseudoclavibacter terrae]|uniref:S41 family peptidase n=1 Tax=Pseudoclavibacter terrae TaxID=1530195 RepID=UPI0023304BBD|nr:S41 family peptidase [Pseudoclavibacter terrae]
MNNVAMQTRGGRSVRASLSLTVAAALAVGLSGCTASPEPEPVPTPTVSPAALVEEAAQVLEEHGLYSGGDWSAERDVLLAAGASATTLEEAHDLIAAAAFDAGGRHARFLPADEREAAYTEAPSAPPTVEATQGRTVTITVSAIGHEGPLAEEYARTGVEGLSALADANTCGFVVDLRGNWGGNAFPMLGAVSPLFDTSEVAGFVDRDGERDAITVSTESATSTDGYELRFDSDADIDADAFGVKPIAVLQDFYTASAAEMVLAGFSGQGNVRTFGEKSNGLATGVEGFLLSDGSEILLTTSRFTDRTGAVMPEPIQPDISALTGDASATAHDWLAEQCPAA